MQRHGRLSGLRRATEKRAGPSSGKLLAERLNVVPGDTIRLVAPPTGMKLDAVTGTFTPRFFEFEVTGLFETGMYEYDNSYVFLPLAVAQDFAGLGDAVTGIEVTIDGPLGRPTLAKTLETSLGFPYRAVDWQEQNRSRFQALKLEKLAMSVILLLIVIVAAFNIVSTLTMVVTDKTREIGILKAMGMPARIDPPGLLRPGRRDRRRRDDRLGFVIGIVLGGPLDKYKLIRIDERVYYIDHMPVHTQPLDLVLTLVASLGVAALATLYPSRQAAKLSPIEAIHHE